MIDDTTAPSPFFSRICWPSCLNYDIGAHWFGIVPRNDAAAVIPLDSKYPLGHSSHLKFPSFTSVRLSTLTLPLTRRKRFWRYLKNTNVFLTLPSLFRANVCGHSPPRNGWFLYCSSMPVSCRLSNVKCHKKTSTKCWKETLLAPR